jgi:cobalt-zinc-cadmium efflux system outer membrane protein
MFVTIWATGLVAVILSFAPAGDRCRTGPLDRAAVVACAQLDHPRIAADEAALAVAKARRSTARVALPSHPQLEVSAATRKAAGIPRAWNLYATLRQELEIGGQRRKRIAVAEGEGEVATARARTSRRELVADALFAYYDVLAVRERRALLEQAQRVSAALATLAKGRSAAGAEAGVTADLAELAAIALQRRALEHERDEAIARATLARAIGLAPADLPRVVGDLAPMPIPERAADPSARSELALAKATVRLRQRETALVRRELVPNPSLSVFVQRDGFAEIVLGAGISLPLPLPGPVGPLAKSRVTEARAREREATAEREAITRGVKLESDIAIEELRARRAIAALYDAATLERARADLDVLATALEAGRMDLREALLAQQRLLEFLDAEIEARHATSLAAVEARRVLGLGWEAAR